MKIKDNAKAKSKYKHPISTQIREPTTPGMERQSPRQSSSFQVYRLNRRKKGIYTSKQNAIYKSTSYQNEALRL